MQPQLPVIKKDANKRYHVFSKPSGYL